MSANGPLLGAHVSIAGGVDRSVERAAELGCEAFQVFTTSPPQWRARALADDEIRGFRDGVAEHGLGPVVSHTAYLLNIASPEKALRRRSVDGLTAEVERAEALVLAGVVLHPGAHTGAGEDAGLRAAAASLDEVHRRTAGVHTRILLETTAGQGSVLGHRFEHLRTILERVDDPERLGVCLDTAHLFAAGYDLASATGAAETWAAFDEILGRQRLAVIHVNDSKAPLGSRRDRHQHIGRGELGLEAFRRLVNDPELAGVPMILETPEDGDRGHRDNLRLLRDLIG